MNKTYSSIDKGLLLKILLINPPVFHAEEVRIKSRLFTTEKYMNVFGEPMGLISSCG